MKECFRITASFEPKCREVCTDAEYERIGKAFFEKEKNLDELLNEIRETDPGSDVKRGPAG